MLFNGSKQIPVIEKLKQDFGPHLEMWQTVKHLVGSRENWMKMKISEVDAAQVIETINQTKEATAHLLEMFEGKSNQINVLYSLQKEVDKMYKIFPIIDVVCNKALQEQHWIEIKEITS